MTCDSLMREAEYYEQLYYRARDALEAYEQNALNKRNEKKEPLSNPMVIFLIGITAGTLGTIAIRIYRKEKRV